MLSPLPTFLKSASGAFGGDNRTSMNLLKIIPLNLINIFNALFRVSCSGFRVSYLTLPQALRFHVSRNTQYVLRFILLLSCGLLLSYFAIPASAQTFDAKVDFYAVAPEDGKPFTVGDQITLRLEVRHPVDSRVTLPNVPEEWEDFDVINQTEPVTVNNNDGTATTGKDIIVSLFEPGSYQTPRLVVTHFKVDGSSEDLGAPVIPLTIESVLVEGDTELRDLKTQAEMPVPPIWPWIVVGFIVVLVLVGLLIGAGLWVYHRRKQQIAMPVPLIPTVDNRPPEMIAFSELDRIEALNLPAKDQFKEHYTLVTDCLRRYIEGRYKIPALERTTNEMKTSFAGSSTPTERVRDFMNVFMESDLVKFARLRPSTYEAYELIPTARTIVEITTPIPEPLDDTLETEPEVVA